MALSSEEQKLLERVADYYVIEQMILRGDGEATEVARVVRFIGSHGDISERHERYRGMIQFRVFQYLKTRCPNTSDAILVALATASKFETYEHALEWLNRPLKSLMGKSPMDKLEDGYEANPIIEALAERGPVLLYS